MPGCRLRSCAPLNSVIRREQDVQSEVQQWSLRNGQKPGENREACENLNQIRNALAHGSPPNSRRIQEMIRDEQRLREALQDAFDCLLPIIRFGVTEHSCTPTEEKRGDRNPRTER